MYESGADPDGAPIWAIQDPVLNRFYRIGWLEYECLLRWPMADAQAIADDINAATPLVIDAGQVQEFNEFLEQHQLIRPTERNMQRMQKQAHEPGWRHWRWWLHNYLFFRVPMLRPQRFLQSSMPVINLLFTRLAFWLVTLASLLGLLLVARQWDAFVHTLLDTMTPTGMLGFAIALVVSKTLHELGHAYVATRFGVRVAHMGVAFLVMWPMLYTDTGESWRLRSSRQRLAISIAGIATELALAGLATLCWALLNDGVLRQAMFYLATTGWVLTLALNVSPFMRFDGYFILSDILDFPNLHERAGAAAKTWLRRNLLGLQEPWLEQHPRRQRNFLVAFALATWLYRLIIFLGIALMVYLLFFKVLGIFLMVIEVIWFILRPIWSELSVWLKRRHEVPMNRRLLLFGALSGVLVLFAAPWALDIEAPAVARPQQVQQVFAPLPAQLERLRTAGQVQAGDTLAIFNDPEFTARGQRSGASIAALNQRLRGLLDDAEGLQSQWALRERLREQLAELVSVQEEEGRLLIQARFDGTWLDVDALLKPGVWVDTRQPVGVLVNPESWLVDAYVEQRKIGRVAVGAPARFYAETGHQVIAAKVLSIDSASTRQLPYAMLATRHGGTIALRDGEQAPIPAETLYRVRLQLEQPPFGLQESRGTVHIQGERQSPLVSGLKNLVAVLIRESGF